MSFLHVSVKSTAEKIITAEFNQCLWFWAIHIQDCLARLLKASEFLKIIFLQHLFYNHLQKVDSFPLQDKCCLKNEAAVPLLTPKPISFIPPLTAALYICKAVSSPIQKGNWRQRSLRITNESIAQVGWEFRRRTVVSYSLLNNTYFLHSQKDYHYQQH